MTGRITMIGAAVVGALLATGAAAQSAKDELAATPWEALDKEPPPKVIVDPPLAEPLSRGVVVIQYRTENFRILPEVGTAALAVSPPHRTPARNGRQPALALRRGRRLQLDHSGRFAPWAAPDPCRARRPDAPRARRADREVRRAGERPSSTLTAANEDAIRP